MSLTILLLASSPLLIVLFLQLRSRAALKSSNEPPTLPYWIPFVGHALRYGKDPTAVYREAKEASPDSTPVSLLVMGMRLYVVTSQRDISAVYRATETLSFSHFMVWGLNVMFGMSQQGRDIQCIEPNGPQSSLRDNQHAFYVEALRESNSLDGPRSEFTLRYLKGLYAELADFEAALKPAGVLTYRLREWTRAILGRASSTAMLGPEFLKRDPSMLEALWFFDSTMFKFGMQLPQWMMPQEHAVRKKLLTAFEEAYKTKETTRPNAIWWVRERERLNEEAGMNPYDLGILTFGIWHALEANTTPASFWMIAQIIKDGDILSKVRAEIDPAFNSHRELCRIETLIHDSPLFRSIYFEVLRFASASVSVRVVVEDTVISGYTFKKGATVMCPIIPHHFDTSVWGADADVFVADRFIRESANGVLHASETQVKPFGGGATLCPGRLFAINEVMSFTATLLHRYDISIAEGETIPEVDTKVPVAGMARPVRDLKVELRMRN